MRRNQPSYNGRRFCSRVCYAKYLRGRPHPHRSHPSEKKGKTLEELYGVERAKEIRAHQSENAHPLTGQNHPNYGKVTWPKARYVPTLGHVVRSKFEEKVFRHLKKKGVAYSYEPEVFHLGETTYRPDALLSTGWYLEVKGPLTKKAFEKMVKFRASGKHLILVIQQNRKDRVPQESYDMLFTKEEFLSSL